MSTPETAVADATGQVDTPEPAATPAPKQAKASPAPTGPASTAAPVAPVTSGTVHALTTFDGARDIPASELPVQHDAESVACPVCQYRFKPGEPLL